MGSFAHYMFIASFIECVGSTTFYYEERSNGTLTCPNTISSMRCQWNGPPNTSIIAIGTNINSNIEQYDRINVVHSDDEYQLQISNLQQMDIGFYSCIGCNVRDITFKLLLTVQLKSVNIIPNGSVEIRNSTTQEFQCSARSIPRAVITWYLNSKQVSETSNTTLNDTVTSTYTYTGDENDNGENIHCNATSYGRELRSSDAILNITYAPVTPLTLNPPDTTIEKVKGEQLNPVGCKADCNPPCQYQWTKDSQVLVKGDTYSKQSLEKTDHGTYICRAWNGIGEKSIEFMLTVNYGPENTTLSPDNHTLSIQEFQRLPIITCNTDCRPNCTKYWMGPNSQVNQSDTLNIGSVQRTDAGSYRCYVNNTVNSSMSNLIVVIVEYGPGTSQTINSSATSIVKIKGQQLDSIRCEANCYPPCQYEWTKDDQVVVKGDILSKQSLAKTDHGMYICRAWNGIGENRTGFMLTVNYGPENTYLVPENTTYILQEFTPLPVIVCNTDCRPNCTKYWIGPNSQVNDTDALKIESIQRTQAGIYMCYVNNTVNSTTTHALTVIVTYGAAVYSLDSHNGHFIVNESQKMNMTCTVNGVPKPKIEWTFNGQTITDQENKTNYVFTTAYENSGNYTCSVNNYLGKGNITKEVFVQSIPRINRDKSTDEKIGLKDGEGLNITVALIGYPAPEINWNFENSSISVNNSFGLFQHTSYLYKPVVEKSDFGIYHLYISNWLGNEEYVFSVEAQRSPDPPVIESAQCQHLAMIVFWNSSFNGGEKQTFIVEATNYATTEVSATENKEYPGENPLNTTVKKLQPGTLYDVVIIAKNSFGETRSEGNANCTTNPSESDFSNITGIAAGAGIASAVFVLVIIIAAIIIIRKRSGSQKNHHDKEPFQCHQSEDDSEGLKDNPIYVSSGSDFVPDCAEVYSQNLKSGKNDKTKQENISKSKERKIKKKEKENKAIELGCVYENAEDLTRQGEQIYANENKGKDIILDYLPQKNKDGLIYADLDLAPLSAERRFVIHGLDNKRNYAIIDLNKKADPLPPDDEEGETHIEKRE